MCDRLKQRNANGNDNGIGIGNGNHGKELVMKKTLGLLWALVIGLGQEFGWGWKPNGAKRHQLKKCLFFSVLSLLSGATVFAATDGTWITDGGGTWSHTASWQNGTVADGIGANATFSPAGGLSVDATVILDSNRSLTTMYFGDTSDWRNQWILNPADSANPQSLTLDGNSPEISAQNGWTTHSLAAKGTDIYVPVFVGDDGSGPVSLKVYTPASGRLPVLAFHESFESDRNVVVEGSWGHVFFKQAVSIDGNLTVKGGGVYGLLDGTSNAICGSVAVDAANLHVRSLQNVPVTLTNAGSLTLVRNAGDVRLTSLTGAGTVSGDSSGYSGNLRLNVADGTTEEVDAGMPWSWITFYKEGQGTLWLNNSWKPSWGGAYVEAGALVINHADALINTGSPITVTVRDKATLAVAGGITWIPHAVTFDAGSSLAGSGTYARTTAWSVPVNFTLAPGLSVGTLTIDMGGSTLTLRDNTTIDIELAAGGHDLLAVNGILNLAGATLNLSFLDGFTPVYGQTFDVIGATTINNDIGGLTGDYATMFTWNISGGVLTLTSQVPEPTSGLLLALAGALALRRRRR